VPPPGAAGTTIVIGFSGYFSFAVANLEKESASINENAIANLRFMIFEFITNISKFIISDVSSLLD
jgi:hypothetical protein